MINTNINWLTLEVLPGISNISIITISLGISVVLIIISIFSFYRQYYDTAAVIAIPATLLVLAVTFTVAIATENILIFRTTFFVTLLDAIIIPRIDGEDDDRSPKKVYILFVMVYHTTMLMYLMLGL